MHLLRLKNKNQIIKINQKGKAICNYRKNATLQQIALQHIYFDLLVYFF